MTDVKTDPASLRAFVQKRRTEHVDHALRMGSRDPAPWIPHWEIQVFTILEALAAEKEAQAAIHPIARLPGGVMVVPAEPTKEMLEAGVEARQHDASINTIYRAMLAALTEKGERT